MAIQVEITGKELQVLLQEIVVKQFNISPDQEVGEVSFKKSRSENTESALSFTIVEKEALPKTEIIEPNDTEEPVTLNPSNPFADAQN
jgi:hypothetical protein